MRHPPGGRARAAGRAIGLLVAALLIPAQATAAEEDLRAELASLRERVAELEARLSSQGLSSAGSDGEALRISQEGVRASVYGFLTSEAVWENNSTGGDRFLNIVPFHGGRKQDDDFFLSANATRLGFRLDSVSSGEFPDLEAGGLIEIDFDTDDGGPRIRHAFAELRHPSAQALLGQTWAVVAQLNPDTVNSDNLFNLGNAYERIPQIRLSREIELGSGRIRAQAGLLQFFGAFDQGEADGTPLAIQQPAGSNFRIRSSGLPLGQARIAWHDRRRGSQVALSVSAGRLKVENEAQRRQNIRHLLGALELVLPPIGPLRLSGEAFWGKAPGFNAGVGQSVVIGFDGDARSVESRGGFVQLAYHPNDRLRCHFVYGIDDPDDRVGGLDLAIAQNQTVLANCFWQLVPTLQLAIEFQEVRTRWQQPERFEADDLRVTQAVYFRF